jgi:hypothetical protein
MKSLIGIAMLVLPFVALFTLIAINEGILGPALTVFGMVAFIVAWLAVAAYFLVRGE